MTAPEEQAATIAELRERLREVTDEVDGLHHRLADIEAIDADLRTRAVAAERALAEAADVLSAAIKLAESERLAIADGPPQLYIIADDGTRIEARTKEEFKARWLARVAGARKKDEINAIMKRNKDALTAARKHASSEVDEIQAAYRDKLKTLK